MILADAVGLVKPRSFGIFGEMVLVPATEFAPSDATARTCQVIVQFPPPAIVVPVGKMMSEPDPDVVRVVADDGIPPAQARVGNPTATTLLGKFSTTGPTKPTGEPPLGLAMTIDRLVVSPIRIGDAPKLFATVKFSSFDT